MITEDAVSASHYTITGVSPRSHTAARNFAGTLGPRDTTVMSSSRAFFPEN